MAEAGSDPPANSTQRAIASVWAPPNRDVTPANTRGLRDVWARQEARAGGVDEAAIRVASRLLDYPVAEGDEVWRGARVRAV